MCWAPKIGVSGTQNLNEKYAKHSSKIKKFMFDDEIVHLNMNCKQTLEYKY